MPTIRLLDPAREYYFQATWDSLTFRLIVREDGPAGREIYNRAKTSPPGYGPYAPTPHYAYLGANEAALGRRGRHGAQHHHPERLAERQSAPHLDRQRASRSITAQVRVDSFYNSF